MQPALAPEVEHTSTRWDASNSLKHALAQISSDKVKERADGQDLLRQIFSVRENCESLADRKDGSGWLHTFQTIFGAVMLERAASLRAAKSTSAGSASSGEWYLTQSV